MSSNQIAIRAFSGDLLNRQTQRNKRRHSLIGSTEEEVLLGFSDVFNDVAIANDSTKVNPQVLRTNKECVLYPTHQCSNYPRCHEFSVKIFAHRIEPNLVKDAVSSVLTEMGFTFIDNLIVSLDKDVTKRDLGNLWEQMERVKNSGQVGAIGVADLTVDQLTHLTDWSSICPDILQVCPLNYNDVFSHTNSTIQQITQIGQTKNIRITTHNDPVCSPTKLTIDLDTLLGGESGKKWTTSYTGRYTQRSKDRNIITMKGYFIGAVTG